MREKSLITIRNATIAGVLASVILTFVIPALRSIAITAFSQLRLIGTQIWRWLIEWHSLPGWSWLLLFTLAALGLLAMAGAAFRAIATPQHYAYTTDTMHHLFWRWQWVSGKIKNLWCFCPQCDATLVYDDSPCRNYLEPRQETHFICENCHGKIVSTISGGNKYYVIDMVEREILRRIRTNEHKRST